MNKIFLCTILLFVVGCHPSQSEIDEAALRIERLRNSCKTVGESIGGLGELAKIDYDMGNLTLYCNVYSPKNKNNPMVGFSPKDLDAIKRYLLVKERMK